MWQNVNHSNYGIELDQITKIPKVPNKSKLIMRLILRGRRTPGG